MGWIGNAPSQGLFNGGQIVDGTVDTVDLKDNAVTASKLASTAIKDKLASDQFLAVPRGTTAQRPVSPEIGYTRYNTDTGALENYTVNGWLKVSILVPTINSISGDIYNGFTSTLTFSGFNFGTSAGTVRFFVNSTNYDVTVTPSSDTSISVAVPSSVYGQSAGSTVLIKYINSDGGVSTESSKTILAMPSGGDITVSGGYRIHKFNSSGQFILPFSKTVDYLAVAGGGGGGADRAGGGGAGGLLTGQQALSANTYTVTVGSGGSYAPSDVSRGTSGSNSSIAAIITTIGGGGGGSENDNGGSSGGSGGGCSYGSASFGSGTSGQGNAGFGIATYSPNRRTGGGGGAGSAATDANGGSGLASSISGSAVYYAGGGGGGETDGDSGGASGTTYRGNGGIGGGGIGGTSNPDSSAYGESGAVNTGGGGGGGGGYPSGTYVFDTAHGGNGGSGIVIIRYPLPS